MSYATADRGAQHGGGNVCMYIFAMAFELISLQYIAILYNSSTFFLLPAGWYTVTHSITVLRTCSCRSVRYGAARRLGVLAGHFVIGKMLKRLEVDNTEARASTVKRQPFPFCLEFQFK